METLIGILAALPWKAIVAYLLPLAVIGIVQILKRYRKELKPYLPIIAPFIGLALPLVANALSAWLGVPVDFSPILGFFAGFAAVGMHQVPKQFRKRPRPGPEVRRG